MNFTRVIIIVLDSVGAGSGPDAEAYGDLGANTLGHVAEAIGGLKLPVLQSLGLGNITPIQGVPSNDHPLASWGLMQEASKGKDTIAGHWELMGLILSKPFSLFPNGFPPDLLEEAGLADHLGNKAASGTEIISELGDRHVKTGSPIVYTSADSVFQIAAHEEVIPLDRLYGICKKARLACDSRTIGRVIARPFLGQSGGYGRTANRKDFPMKPFEKTALDLIKGAGLPVTGVGKIQNIFAGQGLTRSVSTKNNSHGMEMLTKELGVTKQGMILVNLIDFDMLYGHRNDAKGYGGALERFDLELKELLKRLEDTDLLILTADHGCDPTWPGTDHSRERVPVLVYHKGLVPKALGIRNSFADVGATALCALKIPYSLAGNSLL